MDIVRGRIDVSCVNLRFTCAAVQETRMDDLRETIILEMDGIRFIDHRAFIGWRAYETADIRSVSFDERKL
jgi:hypothetical protein